MAQDIPSSNFRAGQGSIIPSLFIGLGGTGSRIVDRIAERASTLPHWESQLRPLTSFVSIDTNELDQHRLGQIPEGNRLNIAAFDKARVIEHFRRSEDEQALQWLDKGYQPRPGFKPGAGQIRLESRLGFFYHSPDIRQRFQALVKDSLRPNITWRQDSPPKFNVYLFCTLAGGTGSGCFLSVAYLIDQVIREQNWQPRLIANLLLSTLMTDKVGPELHADIHANTYAALKELEHLTKLDYKQVKEEGRTAEPFVFCRDESSREVLQVATRPFFISFLLDRPPHLGLPNSLPVIADAAFLQIFTPILDNLAGEYDNYEKHLEELTHFPGELKHVGLGYTKNFGAFGAAALVLPGRDLLEYCALRFAAQALRGQITFGIDPRDPGDDRARALAKLAVNYSDPKFLNMSDEERERQINRAFVDSVQEMARQDARDELTGGFWYQLVESMDEGRVTGTHEGGEPVRAESRLEAVLRRLGEDRQEILNRVSIKERAFVFHKEGVNQYLELVSRLKEDVRSARVLVEEGTRGLTAGAEEGEAISDLKLDPVSERYLVLRLLTECETDLVPAARADLEKARLNDISNPKVQERLDAELYQKLREAAGEKRLFGGDRAFLDARDEAQEYYRKVALAARKTFDAEMRLRQLQALGEYLLRRARQYARLANRMNSLVQDLEADAERLRREELSIESPFALRVEVFKTLDEPQARIWDGVYQHLFLDEGRYLATFDRTTLATAIAQELKPTVRPDGRVIEKSVEQTAADLRRALAGLGRERMAPAILGDGDGPGLDLARGIELEGRLILAHGKGPEKGPREELTAEELDAYRDKKFRAFTQIAGVLARVSAAESQALDDGVVTSHTRQLIVGRTGLGASDPTGAFVERLAGMLAAGGRQVKRDTWLDPRLAIVHDVELPIPLYYFQPVVGEIEDAYLKVAADQRRAYHLHTDFNWEESLPNLNPRRSELSVSWALAMLADGLTTGVVAAEGKRWIWKVDGAEKVRELGDNLSSALYRIGEIHREEALRRAFERRITAGKEACSPAELGARRRRLGEAVEGLLEDIALRKSDGTLSREDTLDRPILNTLHQYLLRGQERASSEAGGAGGSSYERLNLDGPR